MESMAGEGHKSVGGCSEKPLNNRPSVIKIRSTNVDDISDVLTKFYHPHQGVKDINDQGIKDIKDQCEQSPMSVSNNHEYRRNPVLNERSISNAKLAILKLFDDFDPDLHGPSVINYSHEDEFISFQPCVPFRTTPYCPYTSSTSSSVRKRGFSTSSSVGALTTSSSTGAFSTSSSARAFSTSSSTGGFFTLYNFPSQSIYPVNLTPRIFKKKSLEIRNSPFHEPFQYHSEQFHESSQHHSEQPISLSDAHVRERPVPVPVGSGISLNNYQFKSEKTQENDLNNNNNRGFKLVRNNSNRCLNSSFSENASADNDTILACEFAGCGKTFSKRVHLNAHIRVHNGEKPFRCSWLDCGKAFTRQGELKRHEWVHTKPERFYCNNCGKKFSRADHLKMHKRNCKSLA